MSDRPDPILGQPPIGEDDLRFSCPRCGQAAMAHTYGPCPDCRQWLRANVGAPARVVEVEAYEPKMNVVPNQVATKD